MNKTKLAICMKDLEYQSRFVNCFMNHYKHQYELHVYTDLEQLQLAEQMEYAVIITGEYSTEEMANFVERGEVILFLQELDFEEGDVSLDNVCKTEKYQEVYKIAEVIQRMVADKELSQKYSDTKSVYRQVGVFSLSKELYQLPIVALLASIYGEKHKVLLMDLQSYSGLTETEESATMGLEDLMSVATTGNYSKARLLECIRHEPNWDYVYPVQNNQCLAEGTKELYQTLFDIFVEELGYQTIIVNFGAMFLGQQEMMEQCQDFYLLCTNEDSDGWRENVFFQEMNRRGKENFTQRIHRIEIPTNFTKEIEWKALMQKWRWNHMGEKLRHLVEKEKIHGTNM